MNKYAKTSIATASTALILFGILSGYNGELLDFIKFLAIVALMWVLFYGIARFWMCFFEKLEEKGN